MTANPLVFDSVTHLGAAHAGRAAVCASHGGRYAGWHAAYLGVGAVILNDAGIGREFAGIAGLSLLGQNGIPAASLSHRSARIGDGQHSYANGRVSHMNDAAALAGVTTGMSCPDALLLLTRVAVMPAAKPAGEDEIRFEAEGLGKPGCRVVVLDSNSLVAPEDAGHVVVTGSHGGLLGGRPETAVKYPVFAAVYNDADRGIDDAGISRLPALDERGIAAACVSAFSARIGDGRSTLDDGYISAINATARGHGGAIGQSCRAFAALMAEARARSR